jgi:hypothetical protein
MGSPGRRRGRRTRSDEPGGRVDITRGVGGWPVFRHVSFSPEGTWERWRAFSRAGSDLPRRGRRRRMREAIVLAAPAMVAFLAAVAFVAWLVS